ncbi:hypothetical protein [Kitasatospora kifunensis]|uniref:Uncharacterized protein n=1 Tax=Kitasatospora kifunensis TaxID=58351 RepID=A0A7W7RC32_KITKI|nr:hypothetical protein [Kitasatospora kifunensis]MBB4929169.1 hypothetical protein [Kitasatospora kifunensis]
MTIRIIDRHRSHTTADPAATAVTRLNTLGRTLSVTSDVVAGVLLGEFLWQTATSHASPMLYLGAIASLGAGQIVRTALRPARQDSTTGPETGELPMVDLSKPDTDGRPGTPEEDDWAAEAAIAIGQLHFDLQQPNADLDAKVEALRDARLLGALTSLFNLLADRYARRDERDDAEHAEELHETALYMDMARLSFETGPTPLGSAAHDNQS